MVGSVCSLNDASGSAMRESRRRKTRWRARGRASSLSAWMRTSLGAWSAAFATGQEQRESARAEFPPATQPALC